MITAVESSSANSNRRSFSVTSALLPRLTNFENPTSFASAQSSVAVQIAPDCDISAILPLCAMDAAKDAFRFDVVSIRPRQFGPSIRMPYFVAIATHSRSSFAPSTPDSLNPAEITITFLTPACPHSSIASGTKRAGMTITARSTLILPGTSEIVE